MGRRLSAEKARDCCTKAGGINPWGEEGVENSLSLYDPDCHLQGFCYDLILGAIELRARVTRPG